MMRLPTFQLHQPTSLREALALIEGSSGRARFVAGGTDLWPNMKRRHQSADVVISLRRVAELSGVHREADGDIRIGAMTILADVAENPIIRTAYPALARAATSISSPAIRNMGTLGGNLCLDTRCTYYNQNQEWRESIDFCLKEQGSVCWVAPRSSRCWAISASDTAPVLCALGARVRLISHDGEREIELADLYRNDGIDYLAKRAGEVLTEVVLPPSDGVEMSFWKLRRRGSIDFAVLSVGVALHRDSAGKVETVRIYLGAIASAPIEAEAAAVELIGRTLTEEVISNAAHAARKPATPLDNTDFTLQWRSKMVVSYVEGALREIAGLPVMGFSPKHQM